ncbi:uncharacterized protein CDV56_108786 [Aspergillus thermomutatus]|uniref:Uncharacterized protein n=1 Tax=Aspergillus thermomutatus TaxID=41047 RepID=A0A397HFU2_ASPTH|nr:uncharacterized protein CDV56_108786 [Aspergillus thermomutatus]RHZ60133.1 hypothetical protein CDV56_108786 [Aspergillus thermomutatus]
MAAHPIPSADLYGRRPPPAFTKFPARNVYQYSITNLYVQHRYRTSTTKEAPGLPRKQKNGADAASVETSTLASAGPSVGNAGAAISSPAYGKPLGEN